MQTVVGEILIFLDAAIVYPGSMHDARVLRNTDLLLTGGGEWQYSERARGYCA